MAEAATLALAGALAAGAATVARVAITGSGGCGLMRLNDDGVVRAAYKIMSQADIMVTFNGKSFDEKFLRAKFMRLRLPALPAIAHVDLYQVARVNMRIRPKSLKNIIKFLGLTNKKTDLDWDVWKAAAEGNAKSIRYIVKHGAADILATEELYLNHLRPYVRQHPRINGYGPCRRCGADTLERRGVAVTILKGQQHRYQCRTCAGWEQRAA